VKDKQGVAAWGGRCGPRHPHSWRKPQRRTESFERKFASALSRI